MDKTNMTVRDLIKELLIYPMDAPVYVGIKNVNQNTDITIPYGEYYNNNDEIWVDTNGYPFPDGQVVYIKGLLKTEDY